MFLILFNKYYRFQICVVKLYCKETSGIFRSVGRSVNGAPVLKEHAADGRWAFDVQGIIIHLIRVLHI